MKSWFLKRGYPEQIIDYEMEKVNFRENKKNSGINKKKGIPFVVTYHPKLKNLSKIIKDNLYLLYMNDEVNKTFTPSPMISFCSSRKVNSYIVPYKHSTCIPRWNEVETNVSTSFQCGIHVECL